eukprot:jgi/Mesvir1/24860/Mv22094-RA.1
MLWHDVWTRSQNWKGGCDVMYQYSLEMKIKKDDPYMPVEGMMISDCVSTPTPYISQCDDVIAVMGAGTLASTELYFDDLTTSDAYKNPQGYAMGTGMFTGMVSTGVSRLVSTSPYTYEYRLDIAKPPFQC